MIGVGLFFEDIFPKGNSYVKNKKRPTFLRVFKYYFKKKLF